MLDRVALFAPFSLGELVECLVLYHDVEVTVDSWNGLLTLIDSFTPSILSDFVDEFGDHFYIGVQPQSHFTNLGGARAYVRDEMITFRIVRTGHT